MRSTDCCSCCAVHAASSNFTVARFMGRFTFTSTTPSTQRNALPTWAEHEAQLMPLTGYVFSIIIFFYSFWGNFNNFAKLFLLCL